MKQQGYSPLSILLLTALLAINGFFVYELYFKESDIAKKTVPGEEAGLKPQAADPLISYRDEKLGISFSHPASFGSTSPGVYRDGTAAVIHFDTFSGSISDQPQQNEGEATIFTTPNRFTGYLLGGLYDPLSRGTAGSDVLKEIDRQLPIISIGNFCEELNRPTHLDPAKLKGAKAFESLTPVQQHSLLDIDLMRSINSKVVACDRINDETVIFHKTAQDNAETPYVHVYGAIRFLKTPYASFQIVKRSFTEPSKQDINTLGALVTSFEHSATSTRK
ncbi:MAG TPA: hypothetical protein VEB60_02125 [Candidatus Paceibacterota bacterium]|nr:hypothetical protein [Candidatus Paceibacterota bacterium]